MRNIIHQKEYLKKYYQDNKLKIKNYRRLYILNNKEKIDKYYLNPSVHYKIYKRNSIYRNLTFSLNLKQFNSFWQKPCFYCKNDIKFIGLDRIDNKKGYDINNLVSCCITCNIMKGRFSKIEFINQCKKVSNNSF